MTTDQLPPHVRRVLARFSGLRRTPTGWEALCPVPTHNQDGDQHPSLRLTVGDHGVVMLKCRTGCATAVVLDSAGLDFGDLYPAEDGEPSPETGGVPAVAPPVGPADADLVHRAYELVLAALLLSDEHRADLRRRGLPDREIDARGYRSLRNVDRGRAAKAAAEALGEAVLTVPGFAAGPFGPTLSGANTGLLIPVRDLHGRVAALKVRRAADPKYCYLSGGVDCSPGAPVHVPLGVRGPAPVVRLTEGELKSDVATVLSDIPTVGAPGVGQWRAAVPVLRELGAATVVLAFDAGDVRGKPPVFEQAEACWMQLRDAGFTVESEDW